MCVLLKRGSCCCGREMSSLACGWCVEWWRESLWIGNHESWIGHRGQKSAENLRHFARRGGQRRRQPPGGLVGPVGCRPRPRPHAAGCSAAQQQGGQKLSSKWCRRHARLICLTRQCCFVAWLGRDRSASNTVRGRLRPQLSGSPAMDYTPISERVLHSHLIPEPLNGVVSGLGSRDTPTVVGILQQPLRDTRLAM